MRYRHLDVDPSTAPRELGAAAVDDLLDRGDLTDWQPLLAEIRHDPHGPVAQRVAHLVEAHPMYGTSPLFRAWIEEQRQVAPATHVGAALRAARSSRGMTQREVAERMGLAQPEVSRLERRRDVRVSTARAYVAALGGRLGLVARFDDGDAELE